MFQLKMFILYLWLISYYMAETTTWFNNYSQLQINFKNMLIIDTSKKKFIKSTFNTNVYLVGRTQLYWKRVLSILMHISHEYQNCLVTSKRDYHSIF